MSEKSCDSCGAALVEGAKFCKNCGREVSAAAPASAPPPQQTYSPPVPPPQQTYYQAPPQQPPYYPQQDTSPMTVGQFVATFLIQCIPIVGIIMLFVWAFGSDTNINRRNYARAMLIILAVGVALYIVLFAAIGSFIGSIISSMGKSYNYY